MSFTEAASDGSLNGTTTVTLVAAPAVNVRRIIKSINIQNRDTASVTLTLNYVNNGNVRQIASVLLSSGDTLICGEEDFFVLDTPYKSITAILSAAPATTNPDYCAAYADAIGVSTISNIAGGSLAGTYPSPTIASGTITSGMIGSGIVAPLLPIFGYIQGLTTSWSGSIFNPISGKLSVTRGMCADTSGTFLMKFTSGFNKTLISGSWQSGNGNCGFDAQSPALSKATLHVYAISDGNVSDMLLHYSVSGLNPLMPSGMIYSRRIASLVTSGNIPLSYNQIGNRIIYTSGIIGEGQVLNSGAKLISVSIPTQVKTTWIGNLDLQVDWSGLCLISSPDVDDEIPAFGRATFANTSLSGTECAWLEVPASISGQIRTRINLSGSLNVSTVGFIDYRQLDF
jgi:hypothetical protein